MFIEAEHTYDKAAGPGNRTEGLSKELIEMVLQVYDVTSFSAKL